jgi:glycosyltransferase involved in cell wall biosynthesis
MSSLYEGYGMVIAEAMARGLPIVASTGGAAADTLAPEAGLKVPPGESQPLAEAIQDLLSSPEKRLSFAEGSWQAGQSLPRWSDTARTIAGALTEFCR